MSISSEQYKTALFEMCRRALRVENEACRVAYYDMVYQVLEHDGVVVDAAGFEGFREATEGYLNYLSDNNLLTGEAIYGDENFAAKFDEYWGTAFRAIGITASVTKSMGSATFTFAYEDGTTSTYTLTDLGGDSPAEMNIRFYSTLDYAQKVMPYWNIQPNEDTIPLNEIAGNRASFVTNWEAGGLYWHYDSQRQEIEFTGEGELKMTPSQFTSTSNGLGLGAVQTAIYGAGVKSLPTGAFAWGTTCTIVCLHGVTDEVTLSGVLANGTMLNRYTLEIYCDNEAIKAGTFSYVTANWHPLSEWGGNAPD